jgi:hypothetical protein
MKSHVGLGIEPEFWPENNGPRDVLRMPARG